MLWTVRTQDRCAERPTTKGMFSRHAEDIHREQRIRNLQQHYQTMLQVERGEPFSLTRAVRDAVASYQDGMTPAQILAKCCEVTGVKLQAVLDGLRDHQTQAARSSAAYLMRERLGMSYPQIARVICKAAHHSTAISACARARDLIRQAKKNEAA